jgi:C4-dicarboxylate transporter/malic acid transport protein
MGTGILAICLTISPIVIPGGATFGAVLWALDSAAFIVMCALLAARTASRPRVIFATLNDPVRAQVWGAPPMACFTIAVGCLKIGEHVIRREYCIVVAQALFIAGVAGSLLSVSVVPYLMFTRHELTQKHALGSWLLPVVPPIVASVPAALLCTTWPAALRGDLLAFAYALLGLGLMLAACIIVTFYGRLVYEKVPDGAQVTTLWLVVGPLGQSIAGFIALGGAARQVWPELAHGLAAAALAYGVLVWGFSIYWLGMAIALTIRAACKHLPFALSWWAFTFPVGVLTAGTDGLYLVTGAHLFAVASVLLLALLAGMWTLVAIRTFAVSLAELGSGPAKLNVASALMRP